MLTLAGKGGGGGGGEKMPTLADKGWREGPHF